MKIFIRGLAAISFAALAACEAEQEPPVNEQVNTMSSDIENKANMLDAEASNMVDGQARTLQQQADELMQQAAGNESVNQAGNASAAGNEAGAPTNRQ
jgi:Skp family chaperone for outer membrane proteins